MFWIINNKKNTWMWMQNQGCFANRMNLVYYYQAMMYSMVQQIIDLKDKIVKLKTQKTLLNEQHQAEMIELKNNLRNSTGITVVNKIGANIFVNPGSSDFVKMK